ncbi:putative NXPE family member 3-like, partial [Triplophysa rosa]
MFCPATTPSHSHEVSQLRGIFNRNRAVCANVARIQICCLWSCPSMQQFLPPAPRPFTSTRHTQTSASSRISAFDMGISQEEWDRLQKALDWPSPDHEITQLNLSTSPVHTTFSIVRLNDTYNVGDKICVTITARDHINNLKTYGGDFFQAKVFNLNLK